MPTQLCVIVEARSDQPGAPALLWRYQAVTILFLKVLTRDVQTIPFSHPAKPCRCLKSSARYSPKVLAPRESHNGYSSCEHGSKRVFVHVCASGFSLGFVGG